MDPTLLTILPNLSIGVISVLSLVYVTIKFTDTLDKRSERHEEAMQERELALREVEKEVRSSVLEQLTKNTQAMNESTKALERFMSR